MSEYLTTIGLEIHLQLQTNTKAFCGCANEFGKEPNTSICPVCLGFPGSLPVLNEEYLKSAIKVAIALNCDINSTMKFDRKNYFYPDLPKNYQISQYDRPLSGKGYVEVQVEDGVRKIGITRVHMEEDAGKLIHDDKVQASYVDYNRTGTPLLEIVSEPDMVSPDEAYSYLVTLKAILEYLSVSDCNMQEGSLRCDANISLRPDGQKELNPKVELKNMNSFKGVKAALEYEQKRQLKALFSGKEIRQETRLWDEGKKNTEPMRTKEEAHDYRYFPEPDLPLFSIDRSLVDQIGKKIPEMPKEKLKRLKKEYGISEYDASILVTDKMMANFFEEALNLYNEPKAIVNWLMGDIMKFTNANNVDFEDLKLTPKMLVDMFKLIDDGTISGKMAKDIIDEMLATGEGAKEIVEKKGLTQISDDAEIIPLIDEVIIENEKVANEYLSGKEQTLGFLIGQLMKKTKGKANPKLANKLLRERLNKSKE